MQMKLEAANISDTERLASAVGGALLAAYGISQKSKSGTVLAAAGGALIVRGATGYCPGYAVAGIDNHVKIIGAHRGRAGMNFVREINPELLGVRTNLSGFVDEAFLAFFD